MTISISNSTESRAHKGEIGQVYLTVYERAERGGSGRLALSDSRYHEPGRTYTAVVPGHHVSQLAVSVPASHTSCVTPPRVLQAVLVEFQYNSSLLNPLTWRLLVVPKLHVESITVTSLETDTR